MRYSQLTKFLTGMIALVLCTTVFAGLWLRSVVEIPEEDTGNASGFQIASPPQKEEWPGAAVWAGPKEVKGSSLLSRYTLAGTFQVFGQEPDEVESAALVDDQETGVQRILREGEDLGMFNVVSISEDRLRLEWEARSWVLSLTGVQAVNDGPREEKKPDEVVDVFDLPALETSRFGKKVKENYWVMSKEELKGYIDEMMEPQNMIRTVNLYRSFSQVGENVTDEDVGFKIGMKAEKDFFQAMGLQDGDIIRSVNSMKMRTQRRAEYLLKQFYNDRMSAIVLDVERDGESQKHIYLVR